MTRPLRQLLRDRAGNAALEFGILGPAMLALLLGVFQVGIGMQAHNAVRSVAMDTARYATIQYQQNKTLDNEQIKDWTRATATGASYLLDSDRLTVNCITDVSPIAGTSMRTLTITYDVPTLLGVIGVPDYQITYTREVFVPA